MGVLLIIMGVLLIIEIRSLKRQAKRLMINNTPIVIDRKTIFLLPVIMGVLLIITLSWVPC
jgi:hypothetical protein